MADNSSAAADSQQLDPSAKPTRPSIGGFISFIVAVLFFSGIMASEEWWGIFDFTVLTGSFGQLVANVSDAGGQLANTMSSFRGKGGSGAIDGFIFALSLAPATMLAVAMVAVFEHYGAINAASWLLNPLLRPMLGIPGHTALSIVASLQSTDAGAALTRTLKAEGKLTERETLIFATFQMTADAAIGNFLSSGIVFFTLRGSDGSLAVPTTIGACLGVILLGKVFAANLMRLLLSLQGKKKAAA